MESYVRWYTSGTNITDPCDCAAAPFVAASYHTRPVVPNRVVEKGEKSGSINATEHVSPDNSHSPDNFPPLSPPRGWGIKILPRTQTKLML